MFLSDNLVFYCRKMCHVMNIKKPGGMRKKELRDDYMEWMKYIRKSEEETGYLVYHATLPHFIPAI